MTPDVSLREVTEPDLTWFISQQLEVGRLRQELSNPDTKVRTISADGQVVGYIGHFKRKGRPEISYWIARQKRGNGFATCAVQQFLTEIEVRPLFARAAKDNHASIRVLQKCGFLVVAQDRFVAVEGREVEEFVFALS